MFDVIISGGGPTGMMLAAELRLHDVDVLVVERDAEPSPLVRSLGLQPRSVEIMDQRGILDRFLAEGRAYPDAARRFAGLAAPEGVELDSAHAYVLGIAQPVTDRILSDRAIELGARIRRGSEVTGFAQDADGVSVALADGSTLSARWLVGADGGRSLVRTTLGVSFSGEPPQTDWILAETRMAASADEIQRVGDEVRRGNQGFGIGPIGDGMYRAVVPAAATSERPGAPSFDEFRDRLRALTGTDFGAHDPRALTRFTDATRLADRYREGRVLLAGDAAHVHPPLGGQGLNLGIQDAVNLGWKLAAQLRGTAPVGLLDSYETERRPVAADVIETTRAHSVLIGTDPGGRATRSLIAGLMGVPDAARYLIEKTSGIDVRYDVGDPALGRRQRDLDLGHGRLYERMRHGRGVLIDATGRLDASRWGDRVEQVAGGSGDLAASAILLRPDGHVVWRGDAQAGLETSLERWFGVAAD